MSIDVLKNLGLTGRPDATTQAAVEALTTIQHRGLTGEPEPTAESIARRAGEIARQRTHEPHPISFRSSINFRRSK